MTYSFVLHTALKVMEAEWALHVQQQEKEKRKKEECRSLVRSILI